MGQGFVSRAAAAALIFAAVAAGAAPARAQSVMAACASQWKQAQATGSTGGATWPEYLAACKTKAGQTAPAPAAPPPAAPAQAAPAPAPAQTAGGGSVMSACAAQWSQAKAAGTTGGATWPEFLARCKKQGGKSASAAPAPAPAPAPSQGGGFPWWQPSKESAPAPTGAGQYRTEAEARSRCPSDTVVWLNTNSRIYHKQGSHWYARTRKGAYMCEADARAAGDRPARSMFGRGPA